MADRCILDPERDCIGSKRAELLNEQILRELEEHKTRSHETHQQIFDRLNKLETGAVELKTQYASILEKLDDLSKRMNSQLSEALARLAEIERKPAKRWDTLVEKIILCVATGVVTYFLANGGLPPA